MGVDLKSESGSEFRLSGTGWAFYLNLAERYGWRPTGTLPPETAGHLAWRGQYDSSDGQTVSAADALSIAAALDRAAQDPGRAEAARRLAEELTSAIREAVGYSATAVTLPTPAEYDDFLRSLSAFFRLGAFRIE